VRITAQLIDARTDHQLWTHTYLRELSSVLASQGELAQAIADEISANVSPQEKARLGRPRPVNMEAQDLYLQGKLRLNTLDPKSAIDYFQKAIDRDPNYAQAHAALARSYGWVGENGGLAYTVAFSEQKREAARAIALDDAGHIELANVAWIWTGIGSPRQRSSIEPWSSIQTQRPPIGGTRFIWNEQADSPKPLQRQIEAWNSILFPPAHTRMRQPPIILPVSTSRLWRSFEEHTH
jgi:tetratricopeptide (TPR) repeat protein